MWFWSECYGKSKDCTKAVQGEMPDTDSRHLLGHCAGVKVGPVMIRM